MKGEAEVTIRAARPDERALLLALTLDAYAEYETAMPPGHWPRYRRHIERTFDDLGTASQLVAEDEVGAVLGTGLLYPPGESFGGEVTAISADCPEVRLLAVAPAGRGRGVGRALMDACVERAKASGAPGLVLHTMAMMKAARRIYAEMGFAHAPDLDFQPMEDWYVEGFELRFG